MRKVSRSFAVVVSVALLAGVGPAHADPRRDARNAGARWLAAARDGSARRLAAASTPELRLTRVVGLHVCTALVRAPLAGRGTARLARCLSEFFETTPVGRFRAATVRAGQVVAVWHLAGDCDRAARQEVRLTLAPVDTAWRVAAVELIDECDDP